MQQFWKSRIGKCADEDSEPGDSDVRRRRAEAAQTRGEYVPGSWGTATEEIVPIILDANSVKGPLKDWVTKAEVAGSIKASFRQFLETCGPCLNTDNILFAARVILLAVR
jgi:hypothetical protein